MGAPSPGYNGVMPLYEFRCRACGLRQTRLFQTFEASQAATCSGCGAGSMTRLVSRFSVGHSVSQIHERTSAGDFSDPRNIGRFAEERAAAMGVELPSEVRTMIDAARDGDLPAPVKDL